MPTLQFEYPDGLPEFIQQSGGTTMRVDVLAGTGTPQPGTGMLHYDIGDGWESTPMTDLGGNMYQAEFPPAECGTDVLFYVSAETDTGSLATDPSGAPGFSYSRQVAESLTPVFDDDFENDLGWTVQSQSLTGGEWERGVPSGDGSRGGPDHRPRWLRLLLCDRERDRQHGC